mmetsp:Transcript_12894/g.19611  ORF Transcript_12894/g.19611 Transcript_12894/m.19611 type:complete len:187 (-) Transcript_12894:225-785(-)|eukprot:CAMPEP_0196802554 /NCGR_PEP_ID=MMETSP1362-20130617/2148_1 /TAXON_ID=163516 /ORGANISM="Leptocylindrus danicus, Strain CCMP1856" /LENGTH=186 /DNA_ID=CAMNT_0042173879 /DNA_START=88 /DNA_END=648 /DNA_ORIENTATION=+
MTDDSHIDVDAGDGTERTSNATPAENNMLITIQDIYDGKVEDVVYIPPTLPPITLFNIPVIVMLYILAVMKYMLYRACVRTRDGVIRVGEWGENTIGNNRFLIWIYGLQEIQKMIDEAPEKQRIVREQINEVQVEHNEIRQQCSDLEKKIERIAERQAKFEAFLKQQAAAKEKAAKDDNKEILKVD